ncbi:MAG: sugar phosphate isomerase/epimerase family protein, partial [Desertimonas sp.]
MANKLYTMDFSFYTTFGVYDVEAQCQIAKEIGFDGLEMAVWDGTRWPAVRALDVLQPRYDLDPVGAYVVLNLDLPLEHPHNAGILTMLERIVPGAMVDLAIQSAGRGLAPSSEAGDAAVVDWLRQAVTVCARRDVQLLLYPHVTFWMERHADCIRLCDQVGHPNLGIVLVAIHWYVERR